MDDCCGAAWVDKLGHALESSTHFWMGQVQGVNLVHSGFILCGALGKAAGASKHAWDVLTVAALDCDTIDETIVLPAGFRWIGVCFG